VPGYLGNYFYYKVLHGKARTGYTLVQKKPTTVMGGVLYILSFLILPLPFFLFAYLYGFGHWIYSRWKINQVKEQMAVNPSGVVMK